MQLDLAAGVERVEHHARAGADEHGHCQVRVGDRGQPVSKRPAPPPTHLRAGGEVLASSTRTAGSTAIPVAASSC